MDALKTSFVDDLQDVAGARDDAVIEPAVPVNVAEEHMVLTKALLRFFVLTSRHAISLKVPSHQCSQIGHLRNLATGRSADFPPH